jgi:hypothetical protein
MFGLKVQAAQSWQPYVEDQAAGNIRKLALQHFGRRTEHLNLQPHRLVSALRIDASSSITKTIDSLALAASCDDLGRWVTTHPFDATAGRIEMSRRAPHCRKLTAARRGLP